MKTIKENFSVKAFGISENGRMITLVYPKMDEIDEDTANKDIITFVKLGESIKTEHTKETIRVTVRREAIERYVYE